MVHSHTGKLIMMHLRHFQTYVPRGDEIPEPLRGTSIENIAFKKADDGTDFYAAQALFKDDTHKIVYDDTGRVVMVGRDIHAMFPSEGASIVELDQIDDAIDTSGKTPLLYVDGHVQEDMASKYAMQKQARLTEVQNDLATLRDEKDAGIISDEDLERFKALVKYRKALAAVDTTSTPVTWPDAPA